MHQPEALDSLTLPLRGVRLIEASAGTGKTFTITTLYLRLLLGLGGNAAHVGALLVEEILVVTFTEAATQELRSRIRDAIRRLRIACLCAESDDPLLVELMAQIDSLPAAAECLLAAERQMDNAAIYTIHGFCQRMLTQNAFESGVLFERTLVRDEMPLRRQACADFWRRHCHPLPLAMAKLVTEICSGPDALLAALNPYLSGEAPQLQPVIAADETLEICYQNLWQRIENVKQQWRAAATELHSIISQSGINKRSYSKKYLPLWLDKVGLWAESTSEECTVPSELARFSQAQLIEKTAEGSPPQHPLFVEIEQFLASPRTLHAVFLSQALHAVRDTIRREKQYRAEMGFDDLLTELDHALNSRTGWALATSIRQRYPVAMIDEFQDTDPQQYRIFQRIYQQQSECALLLIGDPKQAIYAFRGADIFTYIQARQAVRAHYTLATNWRSATGMIEAVNQLFSSLPKPFVFEQIPYLPVQPASKNADLSFVIAGKHQPALQFWLHPDPIVSKQDYRTFMARQCANTIAEWLSAGQQGEAWLVKEGKHRPVLASDVAVLVRSGSEAALMRDALNALAISSVYLSNRDSVFSSAEAKDLLWLLQAVLAPAHNRALRCALASRLFGLDATCIESLNQNESEWNHWVDEFEQYRQHWKRYGVLPMLREVMARQHLAENILASEAGERRMTDLLHLGELLQEAALSLDSEYALVRWLAKQIAQPNPQVDEQQLRLESDQHLVKIVTIHKAKGLEYSLVCLPFASTFRQQKQPLYHDRDTLKTVLDLQNSEEALACAEQERLAEDLRLLYVALTRAIYHCSVGVAAVGNVSQPESDLHRSALGYLLQQGQAGDGDHLNTCLQKLCGANISIKSLSDIEPPPWQNPKTLAVDQQAKRFMRRLYDGWQVTSYSGLQQHRSHALLAILPTLDTEVAGEKGANAETLTAHTFPRGAAAGSFLHQILESLNFTQPVDHENLLTQLQRQGLSSEWLQPLSEWLTSIIHAPLNDQGLSLSQLSTSHMQVELQFYLPIRKPLHAEQLDAWIKSQDPLSQRAPVLAFQQVQGMLKGFIDLVFCWQGRYYLLDYKSNWLGDSEQAYTLEMMEQAMIEHRYDLQYQLYSLALHRFLRHRIADYDYQRHFGGVFYLFLRGMSPRVPHQGVFHCHPTEKLIEGMDQLFDGVRLEVERA